MVITPPSQIPSFKENLMKCFPQYAANNEENIINIPETDTEIILSNILKELYVGTTINTLSDFI